MGLILARALSQGADGGRGGFEPSHRPPGDRLPSPGLSASPENEGTGCPPRSSSSRIHFRGWFWGVRYATGSGFSPRISLVQQIGPIKSTVTGRGRRVCYLVFNIISAQRSCICPKSHSNLYYVDRITDSPSPVWCLRSVMLQSPSGPMLQYS